MPDHTGPTADVSVRVAWADDAEAMAAVQLRAWRSAYGDLVPASDEQHASVARAWRASLERPGDARNRALVALERTRVVGLAMCVPAGDPDCDPIGDAELMELTVDPDARGRGHGSRLLQAAADTMRADRFVRALIWVDATDDALRAFLTGAGWAPDTAHRELAADGPDTGGDVVTRQVRLHTSL